MSTKNPNDLTETLKQIATNEAERLISLARVAKADAIEDAGFPAFSCKSCGCEMEEIDRKYYTMCDSCIAAMEDPDGTQAALDSRADRFLVILLGK